MKLFPTFAAIKYSIWEARENAKDMARRAIGSGVLRSRGTWLVTIDAQGLCLPMVENHGDMKDITKAKLDALIDKVMTHYPNVTEIQVCGGLDWASSPRAFQDFNYDAWVAEWAFSVWKRDAIQLDSRYSISLEWTGDKEPHYVARFCSDWLGSSVVRDTAYEFASAHKIGYRITESETQKGNYRVVSPTGEESSLYPKSMCEQIVLDAFNNRLLGSFDIKA